MNKIALLITMVSIARTTSAQGIHYVDSLKLVVAKPVKDTNHIAALLNLADAIVYDAPDTAMQYAEDALALSRQLGSAKNIALSYNEIGIVYYVKGKDLEALDFFQRGLKEGAPLNNNKLNGRIYNNLANLYSDLKQYNKALDYYNRLVDLSKQARLRNDEAIALFNIGTVYTEQSNYEKALDHFKESLFIAEADSNMKLLPFILSNIGIVYNKKQEYSAGLPYFEKAIRFANMSGSETSKAQALEGLAKIYLVRKDYRRAEQSGHQSLAIAEQINSPEFLADAWNVLSEVYEKQNKPGKALSAYKNFVRFKDSLLNDDKRQELTRKEIEFEFQRQEASTKNKNDKQLALVEANTEKVRVVKNAIAAGAAVILLAGFISFVFYKRKRDAEVERKEAEFKAQVSDTELKVLRLQMNPHFIFNSLNSISDYIVKHDVETADCYLSKFAKVMRQILEYSDRKTISLAEDLHSLELYMDLEAARLNNKFSYEICVDKQIDAENTLVPPMLLQPLVENSIWHGVSEKQGQGRIRIEVIRDADMINCIVEDNGVGRTVPALTGSLKKSVGLKITRARIDILNKMKMCNAAVELSDLQEGVRVQVRLPLELSF